MARRSTVPRASAEYDGRDWCVFPEGQPVACWFDGLSFERQVDEVPALNQIMSTLRKKRTDIHTAVLRGPMLL